MFESSCLHFCLRYLLLVVALLVVPQCSFGNDAKAGKENQSIERQPRTEKLADGLYLILRSAPEAKKLDPIGDNEKLIANDFHFLEPEEREAVVYLVLQKDPFIPFVLGSKPVEDREAATGKPRLLLQLDEKEKEPLERFTREHVGGKVAVVIGGEVVTAHKIRTAVTGGQLQITRCTKHGCETLFTRLLKDRST